MIADNDGEVNGRKAYNIEETGTRIAHVTGKKDDFLVDIQFKHGKRRWRPTNKAIFAWLNCWFKAEDAGYPEGYGSQWNLFYTILVQMGEFDIALEAAELDGDEAIDHFEYNVELYADDIIEWLQELKEEVSTR